MILLFGNKASKNSLTGKSNNIKNHPVENSGILASNTPMVRSLLTVSQYDTYSFSNPAVINYALYAGYDYSDGDNSFGFMSDFSNAVATLGGFDGGGFDCAGCGSFSDSGSSCSSFSSFG